MLKRFYLWLLKPLCKTAYDWPGWDMTPTHGEVLYTVWKTHPILGYFLKFDALVQDTATAPMFSGKSPVKKDS